MTSRMSRREVVGLGISGGILGAAGGAIAGVRAVGGVGVPAGEPWEGFPRGDARWALEVVTASHGNEAKVRELVGRHPALARATWDWGFGDWESALGAASHTGRRSIAEFLLANGARIDIFAAAMLGYVDVVKAFVQASPGIQKTRGPHGIHLLAHARAGGEAAAETVKYLEAIGGAGEALATEPLSAQEQRAYVGEYSFGPGPADRLSVTQEKEALSIGRGESAKRGLSYLGGQAFFPAGAAAVRIQFRFEDGRAVELKVVDGDPVIEARRIGG